MSDEWPRSRNGIQFFADVHRIADALEAMAAKPHVGETTTTSEWEDLVTELAVAHRGYLAGELCSLRFVDEIENIVVRLRRELKR